MMTGGQVSLSLDSRTDGQGNQRAEIQRVAAGREPLRVIRASESECKAHVERMEAIEKACGGNSVWRQLEADVPT